MMHSFCVLILAALISNSTNELNVEPCAIKNGETVSARQKNDSVSDAEAEEFANQWQKALFTGNAAKANGLIAIEAIVERSLKGVKLSRNDRRGARDGAIDGFQETMLPALMKPLQAGAGYQLVHIKRKNGKPYVLFRLLLAEGGLNYHKFRLQKFEGKVQADYFIIGMSGDDISVMLRENAMRISKMASKSKAEKAAFMSDFKKLRDFARLSRSGKRDAAMKVYEELPQDLKQSKLTQLSRVMAYQNAEDAEYEAVLDQFSAAFPGDSALAMVLLDAAILKEDAKLLMKAYSALDAWAGGDPYLDLLVGACLSRMGKTDKAVELVKDVEVASIGIADACELRLELAILSEDHQCTLEQLSLLRDDYGWEFEDLSKVEGYEKFVKSPQYSQWLRELKEDKEKNSNEENDNEQ